MPQDHLPDEILFVYADARESLTGLEAIDAHLDDCGECWSRVEDYRSVAAEMSQGETWEAIADQEDDGEGQAVVVRFEARLAKEDAEAARLLEGVRESPFRFPIGKLLRRRRLYTGGVVRLLCRWAHDQSDDEPRLALNFAEIATIIADRLPDDYYPAAGVNELRGTAWKEYGMACVELANHNDGLLAFASAERAYRKLLAPQINIATIDMARAIALAHAERYDEALRSISKAAEAFARAGDTSRYLDAKQTEALIHHRNGDVHAATIANRTLYEAGMSSGDADMMARAAHNLGVIYIEQGDVGSASRYFLEAFQILEDLGLRSRAMKCKWGIAQVALVAGNFAEADRRFTAVDAEMQALGVIDPLMKLQHAEALLMLERFGDVEVLASELVATCRAAGKITGALTAAVFLEEAAAARTLSRGQVTRVRDYFLRLERKPELLFVAPPPDAE